MDKKIVWKKDEHGDWTLNYAGEITVRFLTPTQKEGVEKIISLISDESED